MPIEFHCGCGKILKAADEHAGKRAKCKTCGQMVTIPGNRATAAPSRTPATQPIKAVLCVSCGYNLKTGKKLAHQTVLPPDEEEEYKPHRPSPVVKFFTDRIFNAKVWGGLATMVLAAIWFFGALWYGHRFFFYPPIMFIFGAISFLSGLIDGADA
jgi:hypothetical protein